MQELPDVSMCDGTIESVYLHDIGVIYTRNSANLNNSMSIIYSHRSEIVTIAVEHITVKYMDKSVMVLRLYPYVKHPETTKVFDVLYGGSYFIVYEAREEV